VSSECEAASPRAAMMEALKAYEDDAHASIGHLNAMETHVQPADEMRGTTLRRPSPSSTPALHRLDDPDRGHVP
jgi:hypothetical protein